MLIIIHNIFPCGTPNLFMCSHRIPSNICHKNIFCPKAALGILGVHTLIAPPLLLSKASYALVLSMFFSSLIERNEEKLPRQNFAVFGASLMPKYIQYDVWCIYSLFYRSFRAACTTAWSMKSNEQFFIDSYQFYSNVYTCPSCMVICFFCLSYLKLFTPKIVAVTYFSQFTPHHPLI